MARARDVLVIKAHSEDKDIVLIKAHGKENGCTVLLIKAHGKDKRCTLNESTLQGQEMYS